LKRYLAAEKHKGDFEMARIRFKPDAIERVRRERYWGLVEEKPDREGIEVTLLDCSLEWLAGWVLSFGSRAEVLAPDRLQELVSSEAEEIAAKYPSARQVAARGPLVESLLT